jgi:Flp pilus assembly protein TadG
MSKNRNEFASSKGQAFTESALILGPLVFLILGVIDTSTALLVRSTLRSAARSGASYATTYSTQSGLGQTQSIKNVVKRNSMGLLTDDDITVAFFQEDDASVAGSNAPDNIVVVTAQRDWFWIAKGITTGNGAVTLLASSADRMESLGWNQKAPDL